jgi:hypothetical protein
LKDQGRSKAKPTLASLTRIGGSVFYTSKGKDYINSSKANLAPELSRTDAVRLVLGFAKTPNSVVTAPFAGGELHVTPTHHGAVLRETTDHAVSTYGYAPSYQMDVNEASREIFEYLSKAPEGAQLSATVHDGIRSTATMMLRMKEEVVEQRMIGGEISTSRHSLNKNGFYGRW